MEQKFQPGDRVWSDRHGKPGLIMSARRLQGEWWYAVKIVYHDGYYTGTDGSKRYSSNLINVKYENLEESTIKAHKL